jgi:hypothetical protein
VGTFHQTTYIHIPEDSTLRSDAVKISYLRQYYFKFRARLPFCTDVPHPISCDPQSDHLSSRFRSPNCIANQNAKHPDIPVRPNIIPSQINKHRQSDCLISPVLSSKDPSSISYHPQSDIIKTLASLVTDNLKSYLQTTPVRCLITPVRSSNIPSSNLLSFPVPSPNRHADA